MIRRELTLLRIVESMPSLTRSCATFKYKIDRAIILVHDHI